MHLACHLRLLISRVRKRRGGAKCHSENKADTVQTGAGDVRWVPSVDKRIAEASERPRATGALSLGFLPAQLELMMAVRRLGLVTVGCLRGGRVSGVISL
jgi:hypothetical protein